MDYQFYSKVLNKAFDSLDELKEAEKKHAEEEAEKQKLSETKKARANEVEEAYKAYQKKKEKAYKEISEAENKYLTLRDQFAKDYHGYHMTYVVDNSGKHSVTFGDLINDFFSQW